MLRTLILATAFLLPSFAIAQDAHMFRHKSSSCSARTIDRFYCPWFSGQFQGPYFDNGCSVKCSSTQTASCTEAHCDDSQNGQPIYSRCDCK